MSNYGSLSQKWDLDKKPSSEKLPTIADLYDQYAGALLGVIMKIVADKSQAVALLEVVFMKISLQLSQYKPGKPPLFVWVLQIARSTALDALKERKRTNTPVLHLSDTGKVINPIWQTGNSVEPQYPQTETVDNRLKELIDSILFKNCTAEEAAHSLNIPVETVRQQLRIAMLQVRNSGNN